MGAGAPLAGASIASWLMLPHNSLSLGASGAVFGLYAVSVLLKLSSGEAHCDGRLGPSSCCPVLSHIVPLI